MRSIYGYWGKADGSEWHPLAYHMLDVAAVVDELFQARPDLERIADNLVGGLGRALPLLAALHDIGKITLPFQCLRQDVRARISGDGEAVGGGGIRHGELGLLVWGRFLSEVRSELSSLSSWNLDAWEVLAKAVFGHHGVPCVERQDIPYRDRDDLFSGDGLEDCNALAQSLATLLGVGANGAPVSAEAVRYASWWVAGLLVLADWIGSNREWFEYCPPTLGLEAYYRTQARPGARKAIEAAGMSSSVDLDIPRFSRLAPGKVPTPLQCLCCTTPLASSPQLFIVEDVTGSGKTEAALTLVWRLWAAGVARGLYLGLPTQATSNAMFARLQKALPPMFRPGTRPTICLAHGKSWLHPEWRVALNFSQREDDGLPDDEAETASLTANAWLADNRKKALLADVGVGTLDQALVGVLPTRHQCLRLFGLGGKVLVADEVHAYDAYTGSLLETLLEQHARQGGSAVVLSATLTRRQRERLVQAFRKGRGGAGNLSFSEAEAPYPLLTHWGEGMDVPEQVRPDASEAQSKRLRCRRFENQADTARRIIQWAREGRCVAWIRNTVDDARKGFEALHDEGASPDDLLLFHSGFVPADRSAIESRVLECFGKDSDPARRNGKILVATQVVEQSLDLDFDEMVSDLAPIDSLIQRAGRLHRHPGRGERGLAILHILGPEAAEGVSATWYSEVFPGGAYVYPDAARLWRTQRLLTGPEAPAEGWSLIAGVRRLIETVYGAEEALAVPAALVPTLLDAEGMAYGEASLARRTALDLAEGYALGVGWTDELRARTRLGEDGRAFALATMEGGVLRPWAARTTNAIGSLFDERRAWAESEIDLPPWRADEEDVPPACRGVLEELCGRLKWREDRPRVLILSVGGAESGLWSGRALRQGKPVRIMYSATHGVRVTKP